MSSNWFGGTHRFHYPKGRETVQILCWNYGDPFLIDGRTDWPVVYAFEPGFTKKALLAWAVEKQIRCVGFERDTRPARRSSNTSTSTWAVVG